MPTRSCIVGHSSGSFLGIELLARALKLDPSLGRHGPRVVLLTLGANFPIVGFHKASQRIPRSSAAARDRTVDRLDRLPGAQGRDEFLPVRSAGRPWHRRRRRPNATRPSCRCDSARSSGPRTTMPSAENSSACTSSSSWPTSVPHAYDFFMIACGPVPLQRAHGQAGGGACGSPPATRLRGNRPGKISKTPHLVRMHRPSPAAMEPTALRTRLTLSASSRRGRGHHAARAGWLWAAALV